MHFIDNCYVAKLHLRYKRVYLCHYHNLQEYNYLTFKETFIGARDNKLHPAIRSKYVELIAGN